MNWYRLGDIVPAKPRAVALGGFDGLHIGHRAVIAPLARHIELTPSVAIITGIDGKSPCSLATTHTRDRLLKTLAVEDVFELDFNAIRTLTPAQFVQDILHDTLGATVVRCGFNFRFGAGASGDVQTLKTLCAPLGIAVEVADAVEVDGEPVSTSRIRRALDAGDVALAGRMLGRPFIIDVEVRHGQHLGRRLGTPTINQPLPDGFVRPRFGVYATAVIVNGKVMHGVTNVGVRPTVGAPAPLAETWIPDFIGDLYGKRVEVSLVKFLRDETKFEGLTALKEQITRDEQAARTAVFGEAGEEIGAVLFDFDDTLQDSGAAYTVAVHRAIDRYFPHWTPAQRAERAAQWVDMWDGGYMHLQFLKHPQSEWYCLMFEKLFAEWGEPAPADIPALVAQMDRDYAWSGVVFDGVAELLTRLRAKGLKLALVTNGTSTKQHLKIDNSGLAPWFDVTVVSGDEGVGKPDPEMAWRAAAKLGVHPSRCLFVGDYPYTDIDCALKAGMKAVLIDGHLRIENPFDVPCVKSVVEIEKFL